MLSNKISALSPIILGLIRELNDEIFNSMLKQVLSQKYKLRFSKSNKTGIKVFFRLFL